MKIQGLICFMLMVGIASTAVCQEGTTASSRKTVTKKSSSAAETSSMADINKKLTTILENQEEIKETLKVLQTLINKKC